MTLNFYLKIFITVLVTTLLVQCKQAPQSKPVSGNYIWKNVQMVGGGFVDGIVFHPTQKGVRYARTDMGGAYRWNEEENRWQAITDWVSYKDANLMGIESIALDPSDPDKVYLACGTYTGDPNCAILRSGDRGKTFERTNVSIRFGGNESGRGNGERMMVDPNNGKIIYLGTRKQGLWRSLDQGVTWDSIATFPDMKPFPSKEEYQNWNTPNVGIIFTLFDPASGKKGKGSATIYAGVSLMNQNNFFQSKDGGATWEPVPGHPKQYRPTHAVLASDGMMYITYGDHPGILPMKNGGVWKFNTITNVWTDITPDKPDPAKGKEFGYAAVSVDASKPQTLIVSSFHRFGSGGEDIFRTTDGGKTWKAVYGSGGKFDFSKAPYTERTGIHWLFDIEINPANPDHAIYTTGFGGYETFNLTAMDKGAPTVWSAMGKGIEETVALELLSPPKGAPLITAVGDYGGFVHWDLDKPAPEGNFDTPHFGNTDGIACAELKPEIIVRVGEASNNRGGGDIGYSLDFGKTWKAAHKPKDSSKHGSIAVSANGSSWVWTPQTERSSKDTAYYTIDHGKTWTKSQGIGDNVRVVADGVNSKKFYGIDLFGEKLFISTDGGATFITHPLNLLEGKTEGERLNRGDDRGGQDRLYATPGREGDIWFAAYHGLYHSKDEGKTFTKMSHVKQMHGFGFGKAAPGFDHPALYMIGIVDSLHAFYRSDDAAKTWVRINDDAHQWGLVLHITGDPNKYGRVYIGTHGRGTLYGDPEELVKK